MKWDDIRKHFPSQWLLIEAAKAHSNRGKRILDEMSVVDTFSDSIVAMKRYTELHHKNPMRELFVLHTDREKLDITEERWIGVRGAL